MKGNFTFFALCRSSADVNCILTTGMAFFESLFRRRRTVSMLQTSSNLFLIFSVLSLGSVFFMYPTIPFLVTFGLWGTAFEPKEVTGQFSNTLSTAAGEGSCRATPPAGKLYANWASLKSSNFSISCRMSFVLWNNLGFCILSTTIIVLGSVSTVVFCFCMVRLLSVLPEYTDVLIFLSSSNSLFLSEFVSWLF